jgi:hypothetical protein
MNAVQAAGVDPTKPTSLVDPGSTELGYGDNPVLARRQARNHGVRVAIGT